MENKLRELINKQVWVAYRGDTNSASFELQTLTVDLIVKFSEWATTVAKFDKSNGFWYKIPKDICKVASEGKLPNTSQLFNYFISNIYKPI